jgi:predicted house-cleaning noncanonical NTP pyrophosphatase (MazG superfamily)
METYLLPAVGIDCDAAVSPWRKLVRDHVPALMDERGLSHRVIATSGKAYHRALLEKLGEEIEEYAQAGSAEAGVEELADIAEVVLALAAERGVTADELERVRREKAARRGTFSERLVVELDEAQAEALGNSAQDAPTVYPSLAVRVLEILSGRVLAVLATSSHDGAPATTVVSWIVAGADGSIAFALDQRGRAYANIAANPYASLELFDTRGSLGVNGRASLPGSQLAETPFPCALVVLTVEQIRDHGLPTVEIQPPSFTYVGSKRSYEVRETAIRRELSRALGT